MRVFAALVFLAGAILLPVSANADALDHFSIVSNGVDLEFNLAASTTQQTFFGYYSQAHFETDGTVNGAPESIFFGMIFPGNCAVCDTIEVGGGSESFFLALPHLYEIIDNGTYPTATLNFLPGIYITSPEDIRGGPLFTIDIAAGSLATTPEPSSFALLGTGLMCVACVVRKRLTRI